MRLCIWNRRADWHKKLMSVCFLSSSMWLDNGNHPLTPPQVSFLHSFHVEGEPSTSAGRCCVCCAARNIPIWFLCVAVNLSLSSMVVWLPAGMWHLCKMVKSKVWSLTFSISSYSSLICLELSFLLAWYMLTLECKGWVGKVFSTLQFQVTGVAGPLRSLNWSHSPLWDLNGLFL